jgi:hypothetical protein
LGCDGFGTAGRGEVLLHRRRFGNLEAGQTREIVVVDVGDLRPARALALPTSRRTSALRKKFGAFRS